MPIISKNSEVDKVTVSPLGKSGWDISYEELPPTGRIGIVLLAGDEITAANIKVSDEHGLSQQGFENYTGLIALGYLIIFLPVFLSAFFIARAEKDSGLLRRASYDAENIIFDKKPWLLSAKRWFDILEQVISVYGQGTFDDEAKIISSKVFRYLNSEKILVPSEQEIKTLQPQLISALLRKFSLAIHDATYFRNAKLTRYILSLPCPELIPADKWDRIRSDASEQYVLDLLKSYIRSKLGKPDAMLARLDATNLEEDTKIFAKRLILDLSLPQIIEFFKWHNPHDALEKIDSSLLDPETRVWLKGVAYKAQLGQQAPLKSFYDAERFLKETKPEFMSDQDFGILKATAEFIVATKKESAGYQVTRRYLERVIHNTDLGERPDEIDAGTWKGLITLNDELRALKGELETERSNASRRTDSAIATAQESADLKRKLSWQLSIIDRFLSDPTVLERIEEYENSFAPGNFKNLKAIAEMRFGSTGHELNQLAARA